MGSVNPIVLYYDIALVVSIVLTGIYLFMWHKHFDAHITLIFLLVPLMCLGPGGEQAHLSRRLLPAADRPAGDL